MSLKNIALSCCSLGCLAVVLAIMLGYYFFFKEKESYDNKINQNAIDVKEEANKDVLLDVLLVSDMEDDFTNLTKFVEVANTLDPDLIFVLGDMSALGVKDNLLKTKEILSQAKAEVFYIPGDRDLWTSSGLGNFNAVFGDSYQSVTRKGVKFLLVDNSNEYEGIDSVQMDFIEGAISDSDYVFFHNPIYFNKSILGVMGKGMGQYSDDVDNQREVLLSLVRLSGAVKGTFAGDQHSFSVSEDEEKSGLNHVILGSLNTERNLENPNFGYMKIYDDKSFYIEKYYLPIEASNPSQ